MFETYELMKQVCFHHAFFGSRSFIHIYIYKVHIRVYMSEHDTYTIRLFGETTTFFWRPWALKCPWARVATVRDNKWLVVLTQYIYIYNFNQSSQIWLKNNKYSAMDGYGVKAWYPLVHPKIEGKWVFIPPKKKSIFNRFWSIPNILVFSTNHLRYGENKNAMNRFNR